MKRVFKRISEEWENLGGGWELCGKGGGRETRRDWEKLGGTRAVGKLGKERVVVRFGGGEIWWWWDWVVVGLGGWEN